MKIIKYKKLPGNKYKITLDNNDVILYENIIIKNMILLKKDIKEDELKQYLNENIFYEGYYKALNYIKFRMRSTNEIEKYLELASIDINRATLTRIERRGFDNLTSQQKDLIIKATCLQAEYIKEEGIYDDNSISSYSIGGDLTVNEKESQDMADKLKISKLAFFYLKRTGLTNRVI